MYRGRKIGRNDPCPCGSGKKYKRCCGAPVSSQTTIKQEADYFKMNKEIAYKGKIGRQRNSFCLDYMIKKKVNFSIIKSGLEKRTQYEGKTITCYKGCSFCCLLYIEASLQECELIVHYLYQHDDILSGFLARYPSWREEIRKNGDLYKQCGRFWNRDTEDLKKEEALEVLNEAKEENERYQLQNLPCPFLVDNLCSIYIVRPYVCAAYVATSSPQWCNQAKRNKPELRQLILPEILYDRSFYYRELERPVITCMPIAIYEILKGGVSYFSMGGVPGLESLDMEFLTDPEVRPIMRRYGIGSS